MVSIEKRIIRRFKLIYNYIKYGKNYSEKKFLKLQEKKFKSFNLNRKNGEQLFSKLTNKYPFLVSPMNSEHSIFFCSLGLSKINFKNILEIGTYDATNSFLLSEIFPNSIVDTYDLKHSNKTFVSTYHRKNKSRLRDFVQNRNSLLSKKSNINFYELNSLYLSFKTNKKYDLIWIDGSHENPYVSIDLANSLRLISKEGFVMCDDIIFNASKYNQYYSKDSLIALNSFKEAGILDYKLIFKRISRNENALPHLRKYVAIIKKIKLN